jgi:hypothetical protein
MWDGKRFLPLAAVCLLSTTLLGASPASSRDRVMLIFCDVTSSLDHSELTTASRLTSEILRNVTPPVHYELFPIMLGTERASPILRQQVPPLDRPSDRRRYTEFLNTLPGALGKELAAIYVGANGQGQDPDRSCIIEALDRAARIFNQLSSAKSLDLVIVSDMIEECEQNPYGKPIRLNKKDISKEIALVQQRARLPNLSRVRISIVLPTTSLSTPQRPRPPLRSLEAFWRAVLQSCGFTASDLDNPEQFYFGPGLPERFQRKW